LRCPEEGLGVVCVWCIGESGDAFAVRYLCIYQHPPVQVPGRIEADIVIGAAVARDNELTVTIPGDRQCVFIDGVLTCVEDRRDGRCADDVIGKVIVSGARLDVDTVLHETGTVIGKTVADHPDIIAEGLDSGKHPHPTAVSAIIPLDKDIIPGDQNAGVAGGIDIVILDHGMRYFIIIFGRRIHLDAALHAAIHIVPVDFHIAEVIERGHRGNTDLVGNADSVIGNLDPIAALTKMP
jgi:hypothetical protein